MQFIRSAFALSLCAFTTLNCTDGASIDSTQAPATSKSKSPSPSPSSSTPDPEVSSSPTVVDSNNDICKDLAKSTALSDFSALVQRLCQSGTIEALRPKAYKGNGEPDLGVVAKEQAGSKSELKTTSLMMAQASAKSYFNLTKLQVSKPDDFKSQGFETDADVSYSILNSSSDRVTYSYSNTAEAPEIVVSYDAEATFIDLGNGRSFVVATKVTNPKESVLEFRGISVIHSSTSSPNIVDVFSVSDQVYDNNADHATAVSKFKRQGVIQTKRSYRNSSNASKADAFFK